MSNPSELPQGVEQVYRGGYALLLHPVTATPSEGEAAYTVNDPWRLRVIYGSQEVFVEPSKRLDGETLVLTYIFTPEQTAAFERYGGVTIVYESGADTSPIPRMIQELTLGRDTSPTRPLT